MVVKVTQAMDTLPVLCSRFVGISTRRKLQICTSKIVNRKRVREKENELEGEGEDEEEKERWFGIVIPAQ